jgi:hypothetical protein
MPAESIASLRKPGFPKPVKTENGEATLIEYIGATSTLSAAVPDIGAAWGDFEGTVRSTSLVPVEGLDTTSELTITVELISESGEEPGTLESETYELEWVNVARSMYEHPQFAIGQGGLSELDSTDIAQIAAWEQVADPLVKSLYMLSAEYGAITLTDRAKLFARGIELGQTIFEDYAPVARKTSTYVGGPPPTSLAGQKNDPVGFPSLPDGYEWRKSADRNVTVGKRTRWEKQEEWLGAKKVLHDKDQIFWEPPA